MFRIQTGTMHYADINAALQKVGSSQTRVAKKLGVHRSIVSRVIRGTVVSYRIARHISAVTGLPLATLWPARYGRSFRKAA